CSRRRAVFSASVCRSFSFSVKVSASFFLPLLQSASAARRASPFLCSALLIVALLSSAGYSGEHRGPHGKGARCRCPLPFSVAFALQPFSHGLAVTPHRLHLLAHPAF